MSVLTDVMRNPLDPGYRAAADRRAREGHPPRHTRWGTAAVAVLAVALGAAFTWSVVALRAPQPGALAAREVLAQQIAERTDELDRLRTESTSLQSEIDALQSAALSGSDSPLLDQLAADQLSTGTVAATGAGLRITLSDAETDDPETDLDSRVRDSDLQTLVNGLWAAGAEAIAVNGQRLTTTTAIRTAGDAILVDVVPLVGPYTVEAIGDPQGMQTALARSTAGQLLAVLQSTYSIGVQLSGQQELHLPGAAAPTLRSATLPPGVSVLQDPAGTLNTPDAEES